MAAPPAGSAAAEWDYPESFLPLVLSEEAAAARMPYWPKATVPAAVADDCNRILGTVRAFVRAGRLPLAELELFEKDSSISCVFLCNKLEGTLPPLALVPEAEMFRILEQCHDKAAHGRAFMEDVVPRGRWNANGGTSKEEARWQMQAATSALMWIQAQAGRGSLSLETLLDCYARLMNGAVGERNRTLPIAFRHCSVFSASGFIYPSHDHVARHMQSVCDAYGAAAAARRPFLQTAARLHYSSVLVHPFEDGNGRFCRLLVNYAMTDAGFPYAVPLTNGRPQVEMDYMECLLASDRLPADANTALLECFFLEATHRSLGNLRRNLLEKTFVMKPQPAPSATDSNSTDASSVTSTHHTKPSSRGSSLRREFMGRSGSFGRNEELDFAP